MNLIADPVKKKSPALFLAVSAVFLTLVGGIVALYFYEEDRIEALDQELTSIQAPFNALKDQNEALLREKKDLRTQTAAQDQKNKQTIDELLGKDRVLQYQNETLEADIAQKEKKIAELEDKIEKQAAKEESLMSLIEEAKQQLTSKSVTPAPAPAVVDSVSPPAPTA